MRLQRYRTLAAPVEHHLDPIKGSRFIGLAAPVRGEDELEALLADAAGRWPDARHRCWAVRLHDGRVRSSDAGEPGGSAGRPILAQIEGHGLHDVAVVVVRYFGGVKLGVGGLVRAYGGCAGRTLDRGEVVEVVPTLPMVVEHDYADTGVVQNLLSGRGLRPVATDWGERVRLHLSVPFDRVDALGEALADATSGRVRVEDGDP